MDNVTFIKRENLDGVEIEYAIIDKGDGAYTSMLKSDLDAMRAEQAKGKLVNGD
jgi:hypothetical protein